MRRARVLFVLLSVLALAPAWAQDALVSSAQPISVGMSLRGNTFTLDVQAATASGVRVFCPITPGLMRFSGLTQKIEVVYDQKSRVLQLAVPPGHTQVTISSLP